MAKLNTAGQEAAATVDTRIRFAMGGLPSKASRGKALAITKLEEARFWALEAITSDPDFTEE